MPIDRTALTSTLAIAALMAAAIFVSPASAQEQREGPRRGWEMMAQAGAATTGMGQIHGRRSDSRESREARNAQRFHRFAERRIALLDTNHDGKISVAEITAEEKRLVAGADVNGDGKLSAEEFARRGRWFLQLGTMSFFDMLDTNGDGAIEVSEITGPSERWFKRHDLNKNGVIDADEYVKARAGGGTVDSRREQRMRGFAERRIAMLDANGDGKLSLAEITSEEKRLFAAADINGDGKLSPEEFSRRGRWFLQLGTMSFFDMLDANGDGELTVAEITAPSERWFKRHDINKNGFIDADEYVKARSYGGRR